jgi:predicted N-formylglutamate amidohydrolase
LYHVIISCEHAKNQIPKSYAGLFQKAKKVLSSHRGYDIGALQLADRLALALQAPIFIAEVSRLLVDCNRSLHHPKLFSEYTKNLPKKAKEEIVRRYYQPYRDRVEGAIQEAISFGKTVLHLSIHTFTPHLGRTSRNFDVGVLYDPHREEEVFFSKHFLQNLREKDFSALANRPYKGIADGFTTYLRTRFPKGSYIGIEIEVNQKLIAI